MTKKADERQIFGLGHDLRQIAKRKGKLNYQLILCGADCRAFSDARKAKAGGLNEKDKELLTPLRAIIEIIRRQHPNVLWMVECTIFGRIFKNHHYTPHLEPHWQYVKTRFEELEHESQPFAEKIINFGDGLLPQTRRRQLMYNFAIHEDWPKDDVTYSDILKSVKGETDRKKAKTIMAGTNSSVRREGLNNYTENGVETGPSPEIEEQLQGLPGGDHRGPGYTT